MSTRHQNNSWTVTAHIGGAYYSGIEKLQEWGGVDFLKLIVLVPYNYISEEGRCLIPL